MAYRNLNVLDAASRVTDGIEELANKYPRRLLHLVQVRESAESISANIAEGFGRGSRKERDRSITIACGEAEETLQHLAANLRAERIHRTEFWRLRDLLVTLARMLKSLQRT